MFILDMSIYYPIPALTATDFITLIKTLVRVAPKKDPPPHVVEAIDMLKKARIDADDKLVVRIDEDLSTRLERLFDGVVDYVWNELRRQLEFAGIYKHPGAEMFTEEDREELDFDQRLEEARTANNIHRRIFANGIDFLKVPYSQQASLMSSRLKWIESKQLGPALEEIVGHKVVALLKVCQRRYEAMVEDRNSRDGKSATDLRDLRSDLKRTVSAYCGVIGSLYKPEQPETIKIVERALLPVLIAREHTRRKDLGLSNKPQEEAVEQLEQELQGLADDLEKELEKQLGPDLGDEVDENQNE